jgi:hypothetical protein
MEGLETIRMPPIEERLEHLEARRVAGLEGRLQGLEGARVAPLEARVGTLETQAQLQHVTGDRDRLQLAEERINALFAEVRGVVHAAAASPGRGAGAPRMARSLSDLRLDSLLGLEGPPERPLLHATMPEDEAGDRLRRLEAELQGHIATFREAHAALEGKIGDLGATLFKLQASVERPWAGGDRAPSSLKSSADSMPTGLRISSDSSAPSMRSSHGTGPQRAPAPRALVAAAVLKCCCCWCCARVVLDGNTVSAQMWCITVFGVCLASSLVQRCCSQPDCGNTLQFWASLMLKS